MPRRDPQKAIQMLDAMLEFFDGGRRWIKWAHHTRAGKRCMVGALDYLSDLNQIDLTTSAVSYFYDALPETKSGFSRRAIVDYNDSHRSFGAIRKLIAQARALVQAELDKPCNPPTARQRGTMVETKEPVTQPQSVNFPEGEHF